MRRKQHLGRVTLGRVRRSVAHAAACLLFALPLITAIALPARADEPIWATGHVTDADGRAIPGAMVAVYDDANHVVDYAKADKNGDYALAVPQRAIHLERRHGQSFLAEVFGGVTRFVGSTVGFMADPVRAGVHAVTASEASNFADPLTRGGIAVGGAVVDQTLFAVSPRHKDRLKQQERKQPGALVIKVIAPDHNDLVCITHTYWVEDEVSRLGGKQKRITAAWLDPIRLTDVGSDKPSSTEADYLQFTAMRLTPSLAEPGQTVRIQAKLKAPPEPLIHLVVVARNARTGEKWELHPITDGLDGLYEGDLRVSRRSPRDDQSIGILAYAALEQRPGRRLDAERAIESAGLWTPGQPFIYDPLLVVSRNRAELTLTVIAPQKQGR